MACKVIPCCATGVQYIFIHFWQNSGKSEYFMANVHLTLTVDFVRVNWIITEYVNRICVSFHYPCWGVIIAAWRLITWLNTTVSHSSDWQLWLNVIHPRQHQVFGTGDLKLNFSQRDCPLTSNIWILLWVNRKLLWDSVWGQWGHTCSFRGIFFSSNTFYCMNCSSATYIRLNACFLLCFLLCF